MKRAAAGKLLAVFLFFFCSAVSEAADPAVSGLDKYCADKAVRIRISRFLRKARGEGMVYRRFVNLVNEGMLKRVPCAKLLNAVEREYLFQRSASDLLRKCGCSRMEAADLVTSLLQLGLKKRVLPVLLLEYKRNGRISALAAGGNLLVRMRRYGWREVILVPVAAAVTRRDISGGKISAVIRLLHLGVRLRLKRKTAAAIIASGLLSGGTFRSIRRQLRERRPF